MGTNYYLHPKEDCTCCGRPFEPLHIGKSSHGWCFSLRIYRDDNILSLDDWRELFSAPEAYIRSEYGERVEVSEMLANITERSRARGWDDEWWLPFYKSEADFHAMNDSVRGPNGLLRHRIGRFCVGHGAGTWDLVQGEFS